MVGDVPVGLGILEIDLVTKALSLSLFLVGRGVEIMNMGGHY